jgi:hypothetical protein
MRLIADASDADPPVAMICSTENVSPFLCGESRQRRPNHRPKGPWDSPYFPPEWALAGGSDQVPRTGLAGARAAAPPRPLCPVEAATPKYRP